ncbi:DNA repair protein RecO [Robertkochia aurantiaca]|uniref:DNA repair protein RecO n=1 Tax=Robertkochia aurantiaca TaxID=2873700 RepID=UPI001CCD25B8|nr:DNA repair protein RecO [Robertkochia sp. 3YJGBD-33]
MIVKSRAIVISALKYGDSSLIVKLFTEQSGMRSYMLKGVRASRKAKLRSGYFQPLTLLDIVARHKDKGTLEALTEARLLAHFQSIPFQPAKTAVAMFIAEILSQSLREEESNIPLFNFLSEAVIWLDSHDKIANFHLSFLLQLTRFLGFYPHDQNPHLPFFDLVEGDFTDSAENTVIPEDLIGVFRAFLGTDFEGSSQIYMTKTERRELLNLVVMYFKLHLQGFQNPRSLLVLNEVFN